MRRDIIFDTETTGLDATNDRVIEIGAIELIDLNISGRSFHYYLNPQGCTVHPAALQVHGISNEFLADKPIFKDVVDEFIQFIDGANLVAHNASFDVKFLNAELARINYPALNDDLVIDTLKLARQKFPMGPNSLDALCRRFMIDNSHREKHGALLDSEILAEVYIELLGGKQKSFELYEENIQIVETDQKTVISLSREVEYISNLTENEAIAHNQLCDKMGDKFLWNKLKKVPS